VGLLLGEHAVGEVEPCLDLVRASAGRCRPAALFLHADQPKKRQRRPRGRRGPTQSLTDALLLGEGCVDGLVDSVVRWAGSACSVRVVPGVGSGRRVTG
jgi:hypothetical protein